jgi:uncharacterized protein
MRDNAGELLSVDRASRDYSVSPATLYRHLKSGRLRRFRGGLGDSRTYLNRAELTRLMRVRPDESFAAGAQMQGQLVATGHWPAPEVDGQGHQDPLVQAVLGTHYGIAQFDQAHWSVNWFHPERGLSCWYSGEQDLVLSILDDLANRTETATGIPVDRAWRRPSEDAMRQPPRLEQLYSRKNEILKIASQYGASNLRVFGSVARGDAEPGSDIDLLVDLERQRTALDLSGLIMELQELLGRRVDVGEASALLEPMRARVLQEAIPL